MKKRLEVEELSEEQVQEFNDQEYPINRKVNDLSSWFEIPVSQGQTKMTQIHTDNSEETTVALIKDILAPKVILVNHEKRLTVDTTCANLAIKYNFLYISVYQTIKQHIENNTDFGRRLQATKKTKDIKLQTQAKDEFLEIDYSAVHFDIDLVVDLIKHTIQQVRKT